jgi:hypothetical protein
VPIRISGVACSWAPIDCDSQISHLSAPRPPPRPPLSGRVHFLTERANAALPRFGGGFPAEVVPCTTSSTLVRRRAPALRGCASCRWSRNTTRARSHCFAALSSQYSRRCSQSTPLNARTLVSCPGFTASAMLGGIADAMSSVRCRRPLPSEPPVDNPVLPSLVAFLSDNACEHANEPSLGWRGGRWWSPAVSSAPQKCSRSPSAKARKWLSRSDVPLALA